jgi:hypothetical protein
LSEQLLGMKQQEELQLIHAERLRESQVRVSQSNARVVDMEGQRQQLTSRLQQREEEHQAELLLVQQVFHLTQTLFILARQPQKQG